MDQRAHGGPVPDDQGVIERWVRWLYRASGKRYRLVVLVGEAGSSVLVAVVSVVVVATYYDPLWTEVALVAVVGAVVTAGSVAYAVWQGRDGMAAIDRWRATTMPTPRETVEAWEVATTITLRQYRRTSGFVGLLAVVPTAVTATLLWDVGWSGLGAIVLAAVIPGFYGTIVSYAIGEILVRPVVEEVAAELPDEFVLVPHGLSLGKRLRISVPAYTTTTGVVVGGLLGPSSGSDGSGRLVLTVLVSLAVGLFLSLELTNLLSSSITRPVGEVRAQLRRVREEDYDARAPVLSSDELGELAHDFNLMAKGLAEREELRNAFGTYVDKEIVRLILSGRLPAEGVEAEVSLLFCDVRGFTTYAEQVGPAEVVATLNALFAEIVPVVEAYGGHVDKFLGDGLMAVFGAPQPHADHADRAVEAARMIVDAVALGSSGLRVAAGVNSGRVVAGPLGGAGRLNFSVIGDAVNVAARVEAATRETGDDLLVTAATRDLLTRPQPLVSRGLVALKGKSAMVEVFAPASSPDLLSDEPVRVARPVD
ncbi:MAG: Adenylate/guanylate cyclase protein [Nocardioides sp.]|nr:Adenylate/guanylate cyclase protein [Nocardioides sp.]